MTNRELYQERNRIRRMLEVVARRAAIYAPTGEHDRYIRHWRRLLRLCDRCRDELQAIEERVKAV